MWSTSRYILICVAIGWAATFLVYGVAALRRARARRRLEGGGNPREWRRVQRGRGLSVTELARRLEWSEKKLRCFQPSYRQVFIPKRSGGTRELWVPDKATAELQRQILRRLLARLRAHRAACGFERGKSIVRNALPHVGRAVVIRMDVVDFFPTTRAERIDTYFRWVGWNAEAAALLCRITTHEGGLPQGAPSSPRLSNLVNFYLDVQLSNLAYRKRGSYTRYADDITISLPDDRGSHVRGVIQKTRRMLASKGYAMHGRPKLRVRRAHERQEVTGLVVNRKVALSRERRRWLRAVRHHHATGRPASLTQVQLQGWEAFAWMVATHGGKLRPEAGG